MKSEAEHNLRSASGDDINMRGVYPARPCTQKYINEIFYVDLVRVIPSSYKVYNDDYGNQSGS